MPVIEALAAQVPLACSSIEPLKTLAAGHAALFNPEDESQLTAALHRLIAATPDAASAARYARQFTWAESARKTLEVLLES